MQTAIYNPITPGIVAALEAICGQGNILSAVEFMDGEVFALAARDLKYEFPYERSESPPA